MKWYVDFWDKTWSRKYERYNRHHQAIWEAVISFCTGKVVDLGCGPAVMYEGKDIDLTGVDWSGEGIAQAKLHYPKGVFVKALAQDTGLPAHSFDTVLAFGLLDYFSDWAPVVNEMKRLVKPGGTILATLLYGFSGHMWTEELAKKHGDVVEYKHICGHWYLIKIRN